MPRGIPWWYNRFKGCGYRMTHPREWILKILNNADGHMSAEEIYHQVHSEYPGIGLTTVYRTLELLAGLNFVGKIDIGDKKSRYEISQGPNANHHHHLICRKCGKIIDYSDFMDDEVEFLKKIESKLSEKYNFEITSHNINFMGSCVECRK
ncbi:MAG: Fur family transcriptional regulator [Fibrobacterota bacterium]